MNRKTKGFKRQKEIDFDDMTNDPEGTQEIILMSIEERETEMKQLNDYEELYSCIPPQQRDIVSIIEASNIASL